MNNKTIFSNIILHIQLVYKTIPHLKKFTEVYLNYNITIKQESGPLTKELFTIT